MAHLDLRGVRNSIRCFHPQRPGCKARARFISYQVPVKACRLSLLQQPVVAVWPAVSTQSCDLEDGQVSCKIARADGVDAASLLTPGLVHSFTCHLVCKPTKRANPRIPNMASVITPRVAEQTHSHQGHSLGPVSESPSASFFSLACPWCPRTVGF